MILPVVALLFGLQTAPSQSSTRVPPATDHAPASTADPTPGNDTSSKPPRPNPDANGIYHVGDGVTAPVPTYEVEPEFTEQARKQKMIGVSGVALIVDVNGNATNVHIFQSMADTVKPKQRKAALSLDQKALEAVRQYKFSPAMYQGKPVPVEIHVEVNFQIF